jgi:hypothetical protein
MLEAGVVIAGSPEDAFPVLDAFDEVGVDQVIIHMQMGAVPHADIAESIEAFGDCIIPRYATGADAPQPFKVRGTPVT